MLRTHYKLYFLLFFESLNVIVDVLFTRRPSQALNLKEIVIMSMNNKKRSGFIVKVDHNNPQKRKPRQWIADQVMNLSTMDFIKSGYGASIGVPPIDEISDIHFFNLGYGEWRDEMEELRYFVGKKGLDSYVERMGKRHGDGLGSFLSEIHRNIYGVADPIKISNNADSAIGRVEPLPTAEINQPIQQVAKMSVKNTGANNSTNANIENAPLENTINEQARLLDSPPNYLNDIPELHSEMQGLTGVDHATTQVYKVETIQTRIMGIKCTTHKVKQNKSSVGISKRFIHNIKRKLPEIKVHQRVINQEFVKDEIAKFSHKFCAVISGMGSGKTTGQSDAIKLFNPHQSAANTIVISTRILLCQSIANSLSIKTGQPFSLYSNLSNISHQEEVDIACKWLVITPLSLPSRIKNIKIDERLIVVLDESETFLSLINKGEKNSDEVIKALRLLASGCGRMIFMDANMGKSTAALMKVIFPEGKHDLEILINTHKRFQDNKITIVCADNNQTKFENGKLEFSKPLSESADDVGGDGMVDVLKAEIKRQKSGITRAKNKALLIEVKAILGKSKDSGSRLKPVRKRMIDGMEKKIREIKVVKIATLPLLIDKIVKNKPDYSRIYMSDRQKKIGKKNKKIENIILKYKDQVDDNNENKYSFDKSRHIIYALITRDLMAGKNIYFASSTRAEVDRLMDYLNSEFPQTVKLAITREMSPIDRESCNEILEDDRKVVNLHVLAISPKLSMGASFDKKNHFHKGYMILQNGSSTADHKDAIQLSRRNRHFIENEIIIACDFNNVNIPLQSYKADKAIENSLEANMKTPISKYQKLAASAYDQEMAIYRESKAHYFEYLIRDLSDVYGEINYCFYDDDEKLEKMGGLLSVLKAAAKKKKEKLINEALPLMVLGESLRKFEIDHRGLSASQLDRMIIELSRKFERIGWSEKISEENTDLYINVLKDYPKIFKHVDLMASTAELNRIAKAYAFGVGDEKVLKRGVKSTDHLIKQEVHLCTLAVDAGSHEKLKYESDESKKLRIYMRNNPNEMIALKQKSKPVTSDMKNRALIRRITKGYGFEVVSKPKRIEGKVTRIYEVKALDHIDKAASMMIDASKAKVDIIKEIEAEDKKIKDARNKAIKAHNKTPKFDAPSVIKKRLEAILSGQPMYVKKQVMVMANINYGAEVSNGKTEQEAGDIMAIKAQRGVERMTW